jgi:putative methionine-R-sulfoxide reductase with GAF domain
MGHIPGRKKERFYEKKHVVELIAILPPLITAAVGALVNLADPAKHTLGWWLAGATVWLVLASVVKVLHASAQDRERKRIEEYDGLRGALWVLYEAVRRAAGVEKAGDGTLRVCIHRVILPKDKRAVDKELEQLLPFVGGTGGPARRTFSIRSGVIGLAVRKKAPATAKRKRSEHADFVKELVHDWGYTEEEARSITADRQAWMAIPIFSEDGAVCAVVSLDSNVPGFFTKAVQRTVGNACGGIAAYIAEAYG